MIRILQTRTGAPHGNCHAACVASIFEVPLDAVPDHRWPEDVPWQEAQPGPGQTDRGRAVGDERTAMWEAWYADRGLTTVSLLPNSWNPKGYALGSVTNPGGIPHYVVCLDGQIVWDPNPAQDSYDQPIEQFEYFVALNPAGKLPPVLSHRDPVSVLRELHTLAKGDCVNPGDYQRLHREITRRIEEAITR